MRKGYAYTVSIYSCRGSGLSGLGGFRGIGVSMRRVIRIPALMYGHVCVGVWALSGMYGVQLVPGRVLRIPVIAWLAHWRLQVHSYKGIHTSVGMNASPTYVVCVWVWRIGRVHGQGLTFLYARVWVIGKIYRYGHKVGMCSCRG